MKEIDASYGEGGGQIVRTILSLSPILGKPVKIKNMRAKRNPSGLKHQHLAAVEAVSELSGATVEGASVGSEELVFKPSGIEGGKYKIDIGTAGSTPLLLQAFLPAALHADNPVELRAVGGTDVKWSPTYEYIQKVFLPVVESMGLDAELELVRRGHYPKGGGELYLKVEPSELGELVIDDRGSLESLEGVAHVSNLPEHISEREAGAARERLRSQLDVKPEIEEMDQSSYSNGTAITLWAEHENTVFGGIGIGEKGKPAEEVGREAADELLDGINSQGTVDRYLADQLVPYIALSGGRYTAPEMTSHLETNIWTCEQMLDVEIDVEGEPPTISVSKKDAYH